ncbi:MAG: hypothetical protein DMG67_15270, partial [Acidobacteria bacterium]
MRPSRSLWIPSCRWRSTSIRHRTQVGARRNWSWLAAWWNAIATKFKIASVGLARPTTSASYDSSPFTILTSRPEATYSAPGVVPSSRPEGEARQAAGRFSRNEWEGAIADLPNYLYDENTPRVLATPRHLAYIKIAEGCDHPCSFCIIPQLRGKFRSRRFESVVAEAQRLAQSGVREITLIGQDTTCYGEDLGLKDGLALLLERLAAIDELRWVRFL